ncbi:MAG TPA: O-antigen ligase family protein [Sphingomicrobium sp.]|nr:O-antigen ligase family protein [Sphingomicrobium sp.]
MAERMRSAIAPTYLFACLLIGGSAQGVWQNALLQLVGVGIIAWVAMQRGAQPLTPAARQLLIIAIAVLVLFALQAVPLPRGVFGGGIRNRIHDDLQLLGLVSAKAPLSLAPYQTLASLLTLIPPLAVFCAAVGMPGVRPRAMAAALLAGTFAGILLGALQVASAQPEQSPWYLYSQTNLGAAVGFFANANHMATLLVVCIPFLAAILAAARSANLQRYSAVAAITAGAGLVIAVGIFLNRSLAGYLLALPVVAASALIVLPGGSRLRGALAGLGVLLVAGALAALSSSAIGSSKLGAEASTSVQSRAEILATTGRAIADFFPWGSGIGTFREVYPLYENINTVSTTYVIHAHNDYAEILLETGIFGVLLLVAFLIWWVVAVWRVWRTAEAGAFARAASIASGAILLHSFVDYPLRTAAVASVFALCLALLAGNRAPRPVESTDLRPTRHVDLR